MSQDGHRWIDACGVDDIEPNDVLRFDHGEHTYALCRSADGRFFATDGLCTHAWVHLADGYVSGTTIECPKHNGRFDITTGKAKGAPVSVDLRCHAVEVRDGRVWLAVD